MFDNLLFQNAGELLAEDVQNNRLPQSMLFSGPPGAGKLTSALELGRVLSCRETPPGLWQCNCSSCLRHKSLSHSELLVMGPRDCLLEIQAARSSFEAAVASGARHLTAVRYLFVRSIRKLVVRFNPVLWEGDDTRISRAAPLVAEINELLEEFDPLRPLPPEKAIRKSVESLITLCGKLEDGFLYDTIPVSHIRNAAAWAHFVPSGNKKVLIIENADRMQESARNALLKILEEPPKDAVFILTTSRRGAVMPTILSRLRTYGFVDRTPKAQQEVISRVFHAEEFSSGSLTDYLYSFLPVAPAVLERLAALFLREVLVRASDEGRNSSAVLEQAIDSFLNELSGAADNGPEYGGEEDIASFIINQTKNFEPRILFRIFLRGIIRILRYSLRIPDTCARDYQISYRWTAVIGEALEHVTVYNQSPSAALELLCTELGTSLDI
ncbi:MAG: DNA polymerase III [Spirochaetaceae bacterium]|jgi:DNA polymerase-3 subunit gamma/tau|nr:DNA polymerase III [Spirochaetaceae bacterium]